MSESYELPFDETEGKFKAQTITADVVRTGFDGECEIESADFDFPDDTLQLETSFAAGETEVSVDVSLLDDVYESGEFLSIIEKEFEVKFSLVPREYDASGQYSLAPMLSDSCIVKCGPVSLKGALKEPPPEELPIPALGEESTELLLKVTLGRGGRPRPGLKLKWERVEGGCRQHGKLEPITDTTDEEGEVRLSYTAPKLYYRPKAEFFEEYRFLNETGGKELEIFRLKIPLSPWLVFRLRAEKTTKIDDVDYGISSELGPVVEVDPRERLRVLQAEPKLKATVEGQEREFPVLKAEYVLLLGDENGVEEEQEGIRLKSSPEGKLHWEIPELKEAFGTAGKVYTLKAEEAQLPELKLSEASERDIAEYEDFLGAPTFPWSVYESDAVLTDLLKRYRFVFCRQLCKQEPATYGKIRSSLKIMWTGSQYSTPFKRMFDNQFQPLMGRLGNLVWDIFGIAWNFYDWGGKLAEKVTELGGSLAKSLSAHTPEFLQRFVKWTSTSVASKLKSIVLKLEGLIEEIGSHLPSLSSIWASAKGAFASLLAKIEKLVMTTVPSKAPVGKALRAIREWFEKAIKTILGVISDVFSAIGKTLVLIIGKLVQVALKVFKGIAGGLGSFLESCDEQAMKKAVEFIQKVAREFGKFMGTASAPAGDQFLWAVSKNLEAASAWIWAELNNLGEAMSSGRLTHNITGFADVNYFNPTACLAVGGVHQLCEALQVPEDWKSKRERIKDVSSSVYQQQHDADLGAAEFDFLMDCVDLAVMCVEAGVAIAAVIFSGGTAGTLALTLTKTFSNVETAIAALKVVIRDLPQVFAVFSGANAIMLVHNAETYNLTVGA